MWAMRPSLRAAFWLSVYLALVLAPLFALLVGPTPAGLGFWWDFSLALGFAGTAMMGVQFLLTARFRRATAPFGIDLVYYFHRHLALVGFALLLAHPLILFVDNPPLLSLLNPIEAPWHMVAGSGSLVACAVLVASSLWRKPLRLHYDAWRIGHAALAAAAVLLAIVHIDGVGYYVATPWKRALWTLIAGSLLGVLAYVRAVRPARLRRTPYRVTAVRPERGDAWTLALEPDGHAGMRFTAGQFVWLTIRHSPYAMKEHPFSISSCPDDRGGIELTIKELGDFTRTIKTVRPGETAYVDGPYGTFTCERHPAGGYVFIGGGIGLAPIMSMLRALAARGDARPILLICANSRWERIPFREAMHALEARLRLRIVHVLEEPPAHWEGEVGYVTDAVLRRHLPPVDADREYLICGPPPMLAAVEAALRRVGVPLGRVHSELFDLV